ncbi:biopolymer transporter ExbD [candidate division WOR-3 bacterium]|nr:biopolymer transporter ExbD [candidate division WOR-3 bacterium]
MASDKEAAVKPAPNIDILPMACIGLILVVVMMLVAPMTVTHNRRDVSVPIAHTAQREVQNDVSIALQRNDSLFFNDRPVENLDQVGSLVAEAVTRDPYVLVVIRADKECLGSQVLEILAAAKRAGAQRIVCATKRPTRRG